MNSNGFYSLQLWCAHCRIEDCPVSMMSKSLSRTPHPILHKGSYWHVGNLKLANMLLTRPLSRTRGASVSVLVVHPEGLRIMASALSETSNTRVPSCSNLNKFVQIARIVFITSSRGPRGATPHGPVVKAFAFGAENPRFES